MSGPIEIAKQTVRKYCMDLNTRNNTGLCATVETTTFIYTGGEENGFVIGLVNYPRFPTTATNLDALALELTERLLDDTHQWSAMLVNPKATHWITRRPQNAR